MSEKKKSFLRKLFGLVIRNPFNALCSVVTIYCVLQIYILKNDIVTHKIVMFGAVGAWIVLFLANHLLKVILLLIIIGSIAYGWFHFTNKDKIVCEEDGGFWNENTLSCEEKISLWEKLNKKWKIIIKKSEK